MQTLVIVNENTWKVVSYDLARNSVRIREKVLGSFQLVDKTHKANSITVKYLIDEIRDKPTDYTIQIDGIELNTTYAKSKRIMNGLVERLPSMESLFLSRYEAPKWTS